MAVSTSPRSLGGRRRAAPGQRSALARAFAAPLADYYIILIVTLMLVAFGFMMVLSSSSVFAYVGFGDSYYFVKRQAAFLVGGFPAAWLLSRLKQDNLKKLGWWVMGLAALLLMLTFVPGLGISIGGNRNWVQLGTELIRIQPSEFAKLAMIVWGAMIFDRKQKLLDRPAHILLPFALFAMVLIGLVLAENDLGTAMIMLGIMFAMLYFVGTPWRVLGALIGGGLVLVGLMVAASPNRMGRIASFLDPTKDSAQITEQAKQSLYGLASGGWWGLGTGQSREAYGALPQAHTDYVFAIIGEEHGFLGAFTVVLLFAALAYTAIRVARATDSLFTRICALGIMSWFLIQSSANIAVALNVVPTIGVPLPFISYGGSSLMANILAAGVLLSCARSEPAALRALARKKAKKKAPMVTAIVDEGRN